MALIFEQQKMISKLIYKLSKVKWIKTFKRSGFTGFFSGCYNASNIHIVDKKFHG
jgi:hypothetical protein